VLMAGIIRLIYSSLCAKHLTIFYSVNFYKNLNIHCSSITSRTVIKIRNIRLIFSLSINTSITTSVKFLEFYVTDCKSIIVMFMNLHSRKKINYYKV